VLWSRGPVVEVEQLGLAAPVTAPQPAPPGPADAGAGGPSEAGMDLEQWERSLIERALREAEGNQTRAAQRLGISRDTLRYRLKKFGIQG
ncbi:MAG TPA: helix-turn-helix domain-containing protein, partial [Gemmatimonadales bacterium]|nr:helix-turn-helix domain-containing protein [Gemmatimonadales bacterium]